MAEALEGKVLKLVMISTSKTETVVCAEANETLMVKDRTGNVLKQAETFSQLGSVMKAKDGYEHDSMKRIKAAWQKWRDFKGVLCDAKMSNNLKGKVSKTTIRPVLIYGSENWTVTRGEEGLGLLERTEMR